MLVRGIGIADVLLRGTEKKLKFSRLARQIFTGTNGNAHFRVLPYPYLGPKASILD